MRFPNSSACSRWLGVALVMSCVVATGAATPAQIGRTQPGSSVSAAVGPGARPTFAPRALRSASGTSAGLTSLPPWRPLLSAVDPSVVSCTEGPRCLAISATTSVVGFVGPASAAAWRAVPVPGPLTTVTSVACLTPARCLVAGATTVDGGALLVTSDEGAQWRVVQSFSNTQNAWSGSLSCPTTNACYLLAYNGPTAPEYSIWRSSDEGSLWTTAAQFSPKAGLSSLACPSASVCYAGGGAGSQAVYLSTTNAWQTWALKTFPRTGQKSPGTYSYVNSLSCSTPKFCAATVPTLQNPAPPKAPLLEGIELFVTTDGGTTWSAEPAALPQASSAYPLTAFNTESSVSCASTAICFATVGDLATGNGSLLRLDPASSQWGTTSATTLAVNSLSCVPGGRTCVGATSQGFVSTVDAGATWALSALPQGYWPTTNIAGSIFSVDQAVWSAVYCSLPSLCVMVGRNGDGSSGVVQVASDGREVPSVHYPSRLPDLFGAACATTSWCVAVGGQQFLGFPGARDLLTSSRATTGGGPGSHRPCKQAWCSTTPPAPLRRSASRSAGVGRAIKT